jgi:hypothetical protein
MLTLTRVPASYSAAALLSVGVVRRDGALALMRKVGMSETEAEAAWNHASDRETRSTDAPAR